MCIETSNENQCKGCLIYESDDPDCCTILLDGYQDNCPCRQCLVKGLCLKGCEDRDNYRIEVDEKQTKKGYNNGRM